MDMTKEELIESIEQVTGDHRNAREIIRLNFLPRAVHWAAERAFIMRYPEDIHTERLRQAYNNLQEHGDLCLKA